MASCRKCQRELSLNERAIYKRLINRLATEEELLCKHCLAGYFGVSVKTIEDKIEHFRSIGCTLFS